MIQKFIEKDIERKLNPKQKLQLKNLNILTAGLLKKEETRAKERMRIRKLLKSKKKSEDKGS